MDSTETQYERALEGAAQGATAQETVVWIAENMTGAYRIRRCACWRMRRRRGYGRWITANARTLRLKLQAWRKYAIASEATWTREGYPHARLRRRIRTNY